MKVVLSGVPVDLHLRSVQHISDLRHELLIVRAGEEVDQRGRDLRLAKLLDDIDPDGVSGAAGRALSEAASAEGRDTLDLELDLPPEAAAACARMVAALEEADELCRELELLTLGGIARGGRFPPMGCGRAGRAALRRQVAGAVSRLIRVGRGQPPTGEPQAGGPNGPSSPFLDTAVTRKQRGPGATPPVGQGQ